MFGKKYDGRLSFATDAWTSPNHRAYVAITVHLEYDGEPISLLLDIVEVAKSHTGVNLAAAFAMILEDYGISDKVKLLMLNDIMILLIIYLYELTRFLVLPVIMLHPTMR